MFNTFAGGTRRWIRTAVTALALAPVAATADDVPAKAPAPAVDSIVVNGSRLSVESLVDRKVYSLGGDLQAAFGTVGDVLSNIPSVDVDSDGIVSLRGDSNVLILVDGKPSTLFSGKSAGDNLQSIAAADIERIEVLTTPPAQFKADGASGVINIVMRRKQPGGVAGTVQASLGSGGRSTAGGNASYSDGPLSLSGTAAYRRDYKRRTIDSTVQAIDPNTGLLQDSGTTIDETIHRTVPSLGATAQYAMDERQSITASLNWSQRGGPRSYTQRNSNALASGTVIGAAQRRSSGRDPETSRDESLAYSRKLDEPGETLDLSLYRSTSHQDEHYDYIIDSQLPPAATVFNNLGLREDYGTTELDADYVLPLSKSATLKLGCAFEQDDYRFANSGNSLDPLTGQPVPEPALTNDFQYRQRISAVYANYQASTGAWNWLLGARVEAANAGGRLLSGNSTTSDRYLRAYPSLHVDRALSEASTLFLAASLRVSRPDPSQLDPYVDYEYTPYLVAGNAGLKPQYTQSYEMGYQFDGGRLSTGVTGYYRYNRDSVTDVTEYLGNGFSLATKQNLPRNDAEGIEFSVNGQVLRRLSVGLNGNLFHSQIDARALGAPGLQSTTGLNAKAKLDYQVGARDSAQVTVNRTDRRLTPQGFVNAINLVNLGYRHWLTARLTAVTTVSDVFNGQRLVRVVDAPAFTDDYRRSVRGRVLFVGFQYSFGTARKEKAGNFEYDQVN